MPLVLTLLYAVCFLLLVGMAAFVLSRKPRAWLHQCFALTALSLLAWLGTQFFFNRTFEPHLLLSLGRANFVALLFTMLLTLLLVRAIANLPRLPLLPFLIAETTLLAILTGFTPLVDRAEVPNLGAGPHLTVYGPLFTLYLVHITIYLSFTVMNALYPVLILMPCRQVTRVTEQLRVVGYGVVATACISFFSNAYLPFVEGDFRFSDVGPLSTILFLLSVAYSIVWHHLFDVRVLIRKTLVYGVLLSLVLAAYSALVLLVTDRLTEQSAGTLTRFGVLLIAFSFDPVRRFLEKRIDKLLFLSEREERQRAGR